MIWPPINARASRLMWTLARLFGRKSTLVEGRVRAVFYEWRGVLYVEHMEFVSVAEDDRPERQRDEVWSPDSESQAPDEPVGEGRG